METALLIWVCAALVGLGVCAMQLFIGAALARLIFLKLVANGLVSGCNNTDAISANANPSTSYTPPVGDARLQWQPNGYLTGVLIKNGVCSGLNHDELRIA